MSKYLDYGGTFASTLILGATGMNESFTACLRVLKPEGVGKAQWAQHGDVPTGTIPEGEDPESLCSVHKRITRGERSGERRARNSNEKFVHGSQSRGKQEGGSFLLIFVDFSSEWGGVVHFRVAGQGVRRPNHGQSGVGHP